jgi:DNA-binding IclR family transcriptional regulator
LFNRLQLELSLTEMAKQAGLHPSTTYRILQALVQEDLLAQDPENGKYRLGLGLLRLGELAKLINDLIRVARPHVEKLAALWDEVTIVETMDKNFNLTKIFLIPSSYRVAANPSYDKSVPPHCISAGKVLLAHLPAVQLDEYISRGLVPLTDKTITDPRQLKDELRKVRHQGYATNNEEQESGFIAFGVPIREMDGQVIAALSIGGPSSRLTQEKTLAIIESLMITGRAISADLGCEESSPR